MPSWRRVFTSEEAFVESKAGACPPDSELFPCPFCGTPDMAVRVDDPPAQPLPPSPFDLGDWPMPSPPPWPADDEDDEAPDE